jgi:UDP-sugar transporter A1/2/3
MSRRHSHEGPPKPLFDSASLSSPPRGAQCSTDGLTRWTRVQGDYSGNMVAVMSEVFKFPLIATAIASFGGGPSEVLPTFRAALTTKPFANAWIALCYTFNNLLYFGALSSLSAVAYQVLSQSKTLFTAGLMYFIVGKRLIFRQLVAIGMLIAGAVLVQAQELARSTAAGGAAASAAAAGGFLGMSTVMWMGVASVLFSSFISALPNVYYEKVLKTEGENQWVNNLQVTVWIMLWIAAASYLPALAGAVKALITGGSSAGAAGLSLPTFSSIATLPSTVRAAFDGFTLPVWGVVVLKALNGILIPATFKYADNIIYSYARPSSIIFTTALGCILTGTLPSISLVLGVATVVASIVLYSSKPKPKAE